VFHLINKSAFIILLETVDSLMSIWDCGPICNFVDDYAGTEDEEY
jgi:hypothetical protein